ncbi:M56 family metallopeptidase [Sediminicola sp. 1XM1-17]|uniref:M56 family metallopeptidase n=1 Tax=Sediminicola sp. 1XM1-17 TaxID=3127702 RepID=UPI003078804A
MEPFIIYLLKSSGLVLLFLLCYAVLLQKETAFKANRIFLNLGLLISLALPLVTFTKTIWIETTSMLLPTMTTIPSPNHAIQDVFDWQGLLLPLYAIGSSILLLRFIVQLLSLKKLIKESTIAGSGPYKIAETQRIIAPFSFFNYIVYHKPVYTKEELNNILTHEKVHVAGKHSLDIIFMHLVSIFLWFNPFIWLYKTYMEQNLEFIADHETAKINQNLKSYQYLLLKSSVGSHQFSIVNPFFNSLIKKRIVMLNKSKSNKKQAWKYALIIPMLIGFIFLFNIETVAQYRTENSEELEQQEVVFTITKEQSNKDLDELKKEIKSNHGGTLKINGLKRNDAGEISAITVEFQDKEKGMVRARYNEDNGIEPILFGTNTTGGMFIVSGDHDIPFGPSGMHAASKNIKIRKEIGRAKRDMEHSAAYNDKEKHVVVLQENGEETILVNGKKVTREEFEAMEKEDHDKEIIIKKIQQGDGEDNIWIESPGNKTQKIIIKEVDGKKTIEVNGKKISPEDFDKMKMKMEAEEMKLHMGHHKNKEKMKSVFIMKNGDEEIEEDYEEELIHSTLMNLADSEDFKIMIDGKESTKAEMQKLSPDEIATFDVLKEEKDNGKQDAKNNTVIIKIRTKKKQ